MEKPVREHQVDPEETVGPGHPGTHPRAVWLPGIECPFTTVQSPALCPALRPVFLCGISVLPLVSILSQVRRNMPSSLSLFWLQFVALDLHLLFKTKNIPYFQPQVPGVHRAPSAQGPLTTSILPPFSVLRRTGKSRVPTPPPAGLSLPQPVLAPNLSHSMSSSLGLAPRPPPTSVAPPFHSATGANSKTPPPLTSAIMPRAIRLPAGLFLETPCLSQRHVSLCENLLPSICNSQPC